MGAGNYTGGHTKIFISKGGTKWEVSDRPGADQNSPLRKRWDGEIAVETGPGIREVSKPGRSLLSMCAVAFYSDLLTDDNPNPPLILQKEVKRAGGNKKWIVSNSVRLRLFENFYKKKCQI